MKTKLNLVAAGLFLAALGTGVGQPVITQQPQSCTNVVGTTATFTVEATGTEPLAYQWQKLSADVGPRGLHQHHLVLTNVQTSHAGDYRVVVTNMDGPVISDVAHLTVLVPPRITPTTNLQHQAVHLGKSIFAVSAAGTAPLSYQWRLDGADLSGQTKQRSQFSRRPTRR